MALAVTGFECEFVEEPPEVLQSSCPICLMILREPHQVTCCGKSFCRTCIQQIKTKNKPCPTCNQKNFSNFSNLGLRQPLYGYKVYCSNKDEGCDWQGELGQLDKHLNSNPDQDKQEIGCSYTEVKCLYCSELYQRRSIKCHQIFKCLLRPFTCKMCKEFKSTYDDVVKNHVPSCNYRPVECPNTCGNTLKHQEFEEHLSTLCPLSMVECEFSHAGCDVKMQRKDLPPHLSESMVTHMSLLARENKRQNSKITSLARENERLNLLIARDQSTEIQKLKSELQFMRIVSGPRVPPIDFKLLTGESSQPFYSHMGGYKLKLTIDMKIYIFLTFTVLRSEFEVKSPYNLSITAMVMDQVNNKDHETCIAKISHPSTAASKILKVPFSVYGKDGYCITRIIDVAIE